MATDGIVVDAEGQSCTFACEGLDPAVEYDVHYRYTDSVTKRFSQGSVEQGEAADSNGSLSVSYSIAAMRGNLSAANPGTVRIWVHTLPALEFDDEGNIVGNYDHNFGHVYDKGGGDKAEATATIPAAA